jgi:hypothetical protein
MLEIDSRSCRINTRKQFQRKEIAPLIYSSRYYCILGAKLAVMIHQEQKISWRCMPDKAKGTLLVMEKRLAMYFTLTQGIYHHQRHEAAKHPESSNSKYPLLR